jgi:uncharacterized protein (DUF433 family)
MRAETAYSVKEAAVLAGLSERAIRNEIGRGVIRVGRKARGRRPDVALPKGAVFYFRLLRDLPVPLPRRDRSALYRLLLADGTAAGAWQRTRDTLERGMLRLDTAHARRDFDRLLAVYDAGRKRVVRDPAILGGEPVFAGTRLAIRHIGGLALKNVAPERIRAEYPSLKDDDIAFARLFAQMKPPPGRPRKLGFRRAPA